MISKPSTGLNTHTIRPATDNQHGILMKSENIIEVDNICDWSIFATFIEELVPSTIRLDDMVSPMF